MPTIRAYGATAADAPLEPLTIERREVGPHDVRIDIRYCGICHSDVHTARGEWEGTVYPAVVGHEIVGEVAEVGPAVTRHAVGDVVGVGCLVDSCGECAECAAGLEQYCRRATGTYNSADRVSGGVTYGGYSASIVVTEAFVLRIPAGLDPAAAAPILCAGITTYSPLRHLGVGPGTQVGVVGLGGLGLMGLRLAKALGARVTVLSRSERKRADAIGAGADAYAVSTDREQMSALSRGLDVVLSTVPRDHDLEPYLRLLRRDGSYVLLGAVEPLTHPVHGGLLMRRVNVTGSSIGGIAETQELLDLCAQEGIAAEVKVIPVAEVNAAYDAVAAGEPDYRYVIDLSTL